jgi:hypothetical protein
MGENMAVETGLKHRLAKLGFKVGGSALASKVYEREEKSGVARAWIEIYDSSTHYTLVFGLTSRDPADVVYLVEMLNNVLEDFAQMRGFKRVV